MTLTIRPAVAADITHMQELEHDASQVFRKVGYAFCADAPVRTKEEYERGLREGITLIADYNAEAAGFIMLWLIDGHAHITEISVSERRQKQGIGRALITAGEDWARDNGFKEITLTTFRDIAWNAPFYRSLGYAEHIVGDADPALAAIRLEEALSGFDAKPRIAMKKTL